MTPTLVEGRGGIFDVAVDGRRIFSKRSAGRFPAGDEIVAMLRSQGAGTS